MKETKLKKNISKVGRLMANTYLVSQESCWKTKLQLKIYGNHYKKTQEIYKYVNCDDSCISAPARVQNNARSLLNETDPLR